MAGFTSEMTIQEILRTTPGAAKVLSSFHLGCLGCMGAQHETLEQGAMAHGLDVEELLAALNALPD